MFCGNESGVDQQRQEGDLQKQMTVCYGGYVKAECGVGSQDQEIELIRTEPHKVL